MANSWIMALKHWNSMKGGKYVVPKKGTKEYAEVKAVQSSMINGDGLKQLGTGHSKEPKKEPKMNMEGGSLKKALNLAKEDPKQFVNIVNKLTQKGNGMKKKQIGGFLPAFIVPFIPSIVSALGTAAGAFATGAAGAAGAALVNEIVGDGHSYNENQKAFLKALEGEKSTKKNVKMSKKKRGRPKKQSGRGNDDEWVDTNVDIIGKLEEAGVPVPTELSLVNTVYDTFGPKVPQFNPKTGAVRPAPGLFDFLNFQF